MRATTRSNFARVSITLGSAAASNLPYLVGSVRLLPLLFPLLSIVFLVRQQRFDVQLPV
jgi:hypothetical protein